MSLTLVVLSKGGPRLRRLLNWAWPKEYIDVVDLWIDDRNKLPEFHDGDPKINLRSVKVHTLDETFAYIHDQIQTDWGLHLGDDELMGQWFDENVANLTRLDAPYDGYSLPRYNLVNKDHYFVNDALYPDWAQRLFRKGHILHEGQLHEGAIIKGRLGMAKPHIFHFDFLDLSRREREAKWKFYLRHGVVEVSRKRGLPDDYYRQFSLPEDSVWSAQPCKEPLNA